MSETSATVETVGRYIPLEEYLRRMRAKGYELQKEQAAALRVSVGTVSKWVNRLHPIPARYGPAIDGLRRKTRETRS